MKPMLLLVLPWLSMLAVETATAPASPTVLVECERAFAADVAAIGIRAGFLKWLAPTGVVFRPGPVNGIKAYTAYPPTPARLSWSPEFAAISEAGDMGWTTGPWSWRADSAKGEDTVWGEYLSVWRRQPDGRYLATLDLGIAHPEPTAPGGKPEFLAPARPSRAGRGPLDKRHTLWKADAEFGKVANQGGVAVALDRFAAERLLLLREGTPRVVGRAAACETIRAREQSAKLMSHAQFLSEGGDLGYTYGSFVIGDGVEPDSGYYVHIWHRGAAKPWELAVELVQPLPRAKQ